MVTVWSRSLGPFKIFSYDIKWAKTSLHTVGKCECTQITVSASPCARLIYFVLHLQWSDEGGGVEFGHFFKNRIKK